MPINLTLRDRELVSALFRILDTKPTEPVADQTETVRVLLDGLSPGAATALAQLRALVRDSGAVAPHPYWQHGAQPKRALASAFLQATYFSSLSGQADLDTVLELIISELQLAFQNDSRTNPLYQTMTHLAATAHNVVWDKLYRATMETGTEATQLRNEVTNFIAVVREISGLKLRFWDKSFKTERYLLVQLEQNQLDALQAELSAVLDLWERGMEAPAESLRPLLIECRDKYGTILPMLVLQLALRLTTLLLEERHQAITDVQIAKVLTLDNSTREALQIFLSTLLTWTKADATQPEPGTLWNAWKYGHLTSCFSSYLTFLLDETREDIRELAAEARRKQAIALDLFLASRVAPALDQLRRAHSHFRVIHDRLAQADRPREQLTTLQAHLDELDETLLDWSHHPLADRDGKPVNQDATVLMTSMVHAHSALRFLFSKATQIRWQGQPDKSVFSLQFSSEESWQVDFSKPGQWFFKLENPIPLVGPDEVETAIERLYALLNPKVRTLGHWPERVYFSAIARRPFSQTETKTYSYVSQVYDFAKGIFYPSNKLEKNPTNPAVLIHRRNEAIIETQARVDFAQPEPWLAKLLLTEEFLRRTDRPDQPNDWREIQTRLEEVLLKENPVHKFDGIVGILENIDDELANGASVTLPIEAWGTNLAAHAFTLWASQPEYFLALPGRPDTDLTLLHRWGWKQRATEAWRRLEKLAEGTINTATAHQVRQDVIAVHNAWLFDSEKLAWLDAKLNRLIAANSGKATTNVLSILEETRTDLQRVASMVKTWASWADRPWSNGSREALTAMAAELSENLMDEIYELRDIYPEFSSARLYLSGLSANRSEELKTQLILSGHLNDALKIFIGEDYQAIYDLLQGTLKSYFRTVLQEGVLVDVLNFETLDDYGLLLGSELRVTGNSFFSPANRTRIEAGVALQREALFLYAHDDVRGAMPKLEEAISQTQAWLDHEAPEVRQAALNHSRQLRQVRLEWSFHPLLDRAKAGQIQTDSPASEDASSGLRTVSWPWAIHRFLHELFYSIDRVIATGNQTVFILESDQREQAWQIDFSDPKQWTLTTMTWAGGHWVKLAGMAEQDFRFLAHDMFDELRAHSANLEGFPPEIVFRPAVVDENGDLVELVALRGETTYDQFITRPTTPGDEPEPTRPGGSRQEKTVLKTPPPGRELTQPLGSTTTSSQLRPATPRTQNQSPWRESANTPRPTLLTASRQMTRSSRPSLVTVQTSGLLRRQRSTPLGRFR